MRDSIAEIDKVREAELRLKCRAAKQRTVISAGDCRQHKSGKIPGNLRFGKLEMDVDEQLVAGHLTADCGFVAGCGGKLAMSSPR